MEWFDKITHNNNYRWIYVDIDLGNFCTYACSYCPDEAHNGSVPWLEISTLKNFVKKLFDHTKDTKNLLVFNLLGGEPTLYKDIEELCYYIKDQSKKYNIRSYIELLTNGYRKLRWWEDNILMYDEVKISFHPEFANATHVRDVCDLVVSKGKQSMTQVLMLPAMWDKCIDTINILRTSKYKWGIMVKVVLKNFGHEPYDYTQEQIEFMRHMPRQSKVHNRPQYSNKFWLNDTETKHYTASQIINEKYHTFKGWMCYAGIDIIHINRNGKFRIGGACPMPYDGFTNKTIYDLDYEFPKEPIICNIDWCKCGPDIITRKEKMYAG